MKKLMIGNQAVAEGLHDGGLGVVSSYPGTPSTEITEFLSKFDASTYHENLVKALQVLVQHVQ